jgi:flagellar basal-body rod protein FlgG
MRSLNIAATGMMAQQMNIDVISQNLANQTTSGYKAQRAEFQDLIYQSLERVGTNSSNVGTVLPTGVQVGLGVKTGAIYRDTEQGTLKQTAGPLDWALQGKGYFQVEMPDGEIAYTRAGAFKLSPDGEIVTMDGFVIQPAITVPEDAISITVSEFGDVQVTLDGQVDPLQLGQLEIASFINPPGLEAIGNNLFLESAASGVPILGIAGEEGIGSILQGFLENSNVDPVKEITNLIVAQRSYEMNSKVITASDEMLQALNQSA